MLRIAIKTPMALKKNAGKIVDYAFARGIADGLRQMGHAVRIDSGADWYVDTQGTDFDLLLRGRGGFTPQPGIPLISWVIYPGKTQRHRVTKEEIAGAEHTFFASVSALEEFRQMGLGNECSLLLQGFDPNMMYPAAVPNEVRQKTVMVGSNHFEKNKLRPIVAMALAADIDLSIWGRGWTDTIAEPHLVANYLETSQVGVLYRSSKIVLCDHLESMRTGGYISNRIFDALACGAAVISDDIEGLPNDFRDYVKTVGTPADFARVVQEIEAENEAQNLKRHEMAVSMAELHSFSARANQISKTLIELKQKKSDDSEKLNWTC